MRCIGSELHVGKLGHMEQGSDIGCGRVCVCEPVYEHLSLFTMVGEGDSQKVVRQHTAAVLVRYSGGGGHRQNKELKPLESTTLVGVGAGAGICQEAVQGIPDTTMIMLTWSHRVLFKRPLSKVEGGTNSSPSQP